MIEKFFNNSVYKYHREGILVVFDILIIILSHIASFFILGTIEHINFSALNFTMIAVEGFFMIIIYVLSFWLLKVHKSLWKYIGVVEVLRIALAVLLAATIITIQLGFIRSSALWIIVAVYGALLAAFLMLAFRLLYRFYRKITTSFNEGDIKQNAVIIGAGDAGYIMQKELSQNQSHKVNVVGYLDDHRFGKIISGMPVIGKISDLETIKEKYGINIAYIAIPSLSRNKLTDIIDLCQGLGLETKIMKKDNIFVDTTGASRVNVDDISIEDLLGRGEVKLEQDEIRSYIATNTVLVTGAGGSIGSELCRQIIRFHPEKLIMVDINENGLYMLEQEFNRERTKGKIAANIQIVSYITSIRDKEALECIFEEVKPAVVFHAAAHKHVPLMEMRPAEAVKNNIFGTNNVIQTCIEYKVSRFILISTDKAVNPTNVMGATKRITELLLQANGTNNVTKMAAVRFGNVLGSNGSVVPIFKKQIAEGGPLTITDKRITRYFMTIPEAAQLVLQAGYYANNGEIFVLDMGNPIKILSLAEKMIQLTGLKPYEDIQIIEIGLRPGEKMYEELSLGNETTKRTKNDLIFMNEVREINKEEVYDFLEELKKVCFSKQTDKKEIKNMLLDFIKDR